MKIPNRENRMISLRKDWKMKEEIQNLELSEEECVKSEVDDTIMVDKEEDTVTVEEETQEERITKVAENLAKALEEEEAAEKKKLANTKSDALIEELNDRIRRNMAEFDNFRKRTEKEKSEMFDMGAKNTLEKILPTIDNFERALKSVPEGKECEAFASGMDMIYKQLLKDLENIGVKSIEAVGKSFDPNLHNAVMHIEDDKIDESTVVEEFQKGYMYKDTVLRYSVVKVAN